MRPTFHQPKLARLSMDADLAPGSHRDGRGGEPERLPEPQPGSAPAVERGHLLAYRFYDIADEVELSRVPALLAQGATRLKLLREGSQYLELRNPPVSVSLGTRDLNLASGTFSGELRARIYDYGAAAFVLRVPIAAGTDFDSLIALADALYESAPFDALCRSEAAQLAKRLEPALEQPHLWEGDESYTVVFVEAFEGARTTAEVLQRCDIARLLLGERKLRISAQQRDDVMRHRHSYADDDLVVIDWNSAFVYEPSGSPDIPDVLEIANTQLLELRYYDALLDRALDRIYDEVNRAKKPWWSLFSSKYNRLLRRTSALTLELGEFTERVENALRIIGDFYLARVYQSGVARLRIDDWERSVSRKETSVEQVYGLLKSEIDTDRLLWLEVTVVLLILGELLLAVRLV